MSGFRWGYWLRWQYAKIMFHFFSLYVCYSIYDVMTVILNALVCICNIESLIGS